MRTLPYWRYLFLVLFILSLFHNLLIAQPSVQSSTHSIDAYFQRLEAFGLSGSLLIGNKEQIFLKKDYGNGPFSNEVDPAYLVGSLSKQFTATAILVLEQRGLLSTDDKLSTHLPNIPTR